MTNRKDIFVYAHWTPLKNPVLIGVLKAQQAKGRKAFSFTYDPEWINSPEQRLLDPDIGWYPGAQYPNNKENFGIFMDSMPDVWGRTLMQRAAVQKARVEGKAPPTLYDIDFLLGVSDKTRMGALRFKLDPDGPFLNNDDEQPIPHWSRNKELQHAASVLESDKDDERVKKWLDILIAPGSSLGGARPKANIIDGEQHPWIAKFPSVADTYNKGAWEYLAWQLAILAGIDMSESRIEKVSGKYHTFFTKRFDRLKSERIHFASAMTMTGQNEETIKSKPASYLDIAEFVQYSGANNTEDLHQMWRRIVFNIAISNTDDHLRNHGFILKADGWHLSPAFDINPSIDKKGLALNIDMSDNSLSFELAKSVGDYFQLELSQMNKIIKDVLKARQNWRDISHKVGISKAEQDIMSAAMRVEK